jgi:hypothetical protein
MPAPKPRKGASLPGEGARVWAEQGRRPGDIACLTFYSVRDGWRAHAVDTLTDEGWVGIPFGR